MKTLAILLTMLTLQTFAKQIDGIQSFPFKECEILCIQDTPGKHPQKLFTDTGNSGFRQREDFYESSINVFLLRKDGKIALIDAGNAPERGSLRKKLQKANIRPEEISDIFITHIHPDHVGGLLWEGKALFPNATLHIAKEELEAWKKDANRSGLAKFLSPYKQKLNAFEFEKPLPCGLIPLKREGHTPGHTIFQLLLQDKEQVIFVGDIVHAVSLQFPYPTFCARYDSSPKEAVASRIETLQMKGLLFGAHFPFPGVAQGGAVSSGAPHWSFVYRGVKTPLKTTPAAE